MITPEWLRLLDNTGYTVMRFLLSTLWQSSLLLLGVGLLDYLLRRRKAAVRHALWTFAVLAVPLIPLLSHGITKIGTPHKELAVIPVYETQQVKITETPGFTNTSKRNNRTSSTGRA